MLNLHCSKTQNSHTTTALTTTTATAIKTSYRRRRGVHLTKRITTTTSSFLLLLLLVSLLQRTTRSLPLSFTGTTPTTVWKNLRKNMSTTTTLVVGATGGTGKYVVQMLLSQGQKVKVIVRSKERMLSLLDELFVKGEEGSSTPYNKDLLTIIETSSFADLSDSQLEEQVQDCDAVVSCLGHNLNWKGIYKDGPFVTQAVQRLTKAILDSSKSTTAKKFILMGSDGVANPNGKDTPRPFSERSILFLIRNLIPPHADNEAAAAFLHSLKEEDDATKQQSSLEWTVVRPTDLIDGEPTGNYEIFDKPRGGLFGSGASTRSNVANFMADLVVQDSLWQEWKFQMPFIQDKPSPTSATTTTTTTTTAGTSDETATATTAEK